MTKVPFNVFNDKLLRLNMRQFADTTGPVQPTRGKDVLYFVQSVNASIGADALLPGQQTEGGWTVEGDLIDEQTKTGRIVDYGTDTESIELTLYEVKSDEGQAALREAKAKHLKVKVWRVTVAPLNANGMHDAYFSYAVVESIETSESDSFVELTVSLQIDGSSQAGEFPKIPEDVLAQAQYPYELPGETGVDDGSGDGSGGTGGDDTVNSEATTAPKTAAKKAKEQKVGV